MKNRLSITDIPRNAGEPDNFGIEPFEKGLTAFIQTSNTPITIALQGEWGSGKTSLMNSLKKNLSAESNPEFYSVWLNTWEYALMKDAQSTLIDIIIKLIQETSAIAAIDESQTKKLVKKVWSWTKKVVEVVGKVAANNTVEGLGDEAAKLYEPEKSSVGEVRNELEKIIKNCIAKDNKKGFIFFIDDLDRIDPPVAVELLELLKNIFTLENCVFILAIDYDVVVKGLEPKFGKLSEQNEREFRSFFDKLIQVPFSMPVTSYKIDTFLKERLLSTNYITNQHAANNELIGKFSEICNLTVGTNPRALKRLLNSLLLIKCINQAKGSNNDLTNELDLLVNFTLVSIQIAYPLVYRLLAQHSDFDKWDENVALQMNLPALEQLSIDKLSKSEEFNEEWERVLFRLCENDHYLKRKALYISRLLNSLKVYVVEKGEDIGQIIEAIITLSSVTNLETNDNKSTEAPNYHKGRFLKNLLEKIIPKLKTSLPSIANDIRQQGTRIESNAYIKFTKEDWRRFIRLSSDLRDGKVRLIIFTEKWVCKTHYGKSLKECISKAGLVKEFEQVEEDYNNVIPKDNDFSSLKMYDKVSERKDWHIMELYTYFTLPSDKDFDKSENIEKLNDLIVGLYAISTQLSELGGQIQSMYAVQ